MNERARRIKELITQSEKTYQELELITGVKKSSLQRYASGVTAKIPMDVIEKLENAFNVPRGYIMGWNETAEAETETDTQKEQPTEFDGLSDKRKALMQFAMSVPEDKAEMILQVMKTILEND